MGKSVCQVVVHVEARRRRGMGNMSNSPLCRRRGRQSHVERSHAAPSALSIVLLLRSSTSAMRPNPACDGTFHSRVRVRVRLRQLIQLFLAAGCLLHPLVYLPPVSRPHHYHPGMARHPWASPEQLVFLKSFIHLLPQAKGSTGLGTLYTQVYDAFLLKWDAEPIVPPPGPPLAPEELEVRAKGRLQRVSVVLKAPVFSSHKFASASDTGTTKCRRRKNIQPSPTPNHLAFSTCLGSPTVRSFPINSTKHILFSIGGQRTRHSAVRLKTSGLGRARILSRKPSNRS